MRYLCLRYEEEAKLRTLPGAEAEAIRAEHLAATESIQQDGHYCCGEILQPADTAATVRVQNGIAVTPDGAFAESKEQLGEVLIIAHDLNETIQVASKLPSARLDTNEVRPVLEIPSANSCILTERRRTMGARSPYSHVERTTRVAHPAHSDGGLRMKYPLLIYGDEQALTETERQDCYAESTQLVANLHSDGQYLGAHPLPPTAMATSVRVRDGKRLVTDGPFAETREQLGGYSLVEVKARDEAIAVAAKIPMVRKGTVEVRPVIEIPGISQF
ncbi:MAG: YciI family protein [Nitrospiraceae bacterium]